MAARRMGIIALLLCVCLCLMPIRALAVSTADALEPVSTERECSLTLSYTCNGMAFSGVTVKLYQIAELSAAVRYTLTDPFASSGLLLNGIQSVGEWDVVRTTLESYILANGIRENRSAVTDGSGQVSFENLNPGLYLAVAGAVAQTVWATLLKNNEVSQVIIFILFVPIFGVLLSALILPGESVSPTIAAALVLVCTGIAMANFTRKKT